MASSHAVQDHGQNLSAWADFWRGLTPEGEIRMWDFYGGRPWVLKHAPRFGTVVEAGCGLGRYVFLLSRLGVDVEGLDFHAPTVEALRAWGAEHGFNCRFAVGDVCRMPYRDGEVSGYLSFGVVEHFYEGPHRALAEAARVLRPGGVAIISTPSVSFAQTYFRLRKAARDAVKRAIRWPRKPVPFFQYWYTPGQLRQFVAAAGLRVVLSGGCDVKYAAWELGARLGGRNLWFWLADGLERTPLAGWGAQAFTVSIKEAPLMHCFLCGELSATRQSLEYAYLPICGRCMAHPAAGYYRRARPPRFHADWQHAPLSADAGRLRQCHFCAATFAGDPLFDEHHGFSVPICPSCMASPAVNLVASNEYLLPVWRSRQ